MKIHGTPNARFWDYVGGGWVKLTLRPGQTLTRTSGGPTDEGCSYENETWEHLGGSVGYSCQSWGRDCDGRHEAESVAFLPIGRTGCCPAEPVSPGWNRGMYTQRDHTAEAAGY